MIITVENERNLRDAYVLIRALRKIRQTQDVRDIIKRQKWAIRSYYNRHRVEYPRLIAGDYDSCVFLDKLPIAVRTAEEAVACFERDFYVPTPRSAYDCTGKSFTTRYKVFCRRGEWYVYHFMARDV